MKKIISIVLIVIVGLVALSEFRKSQKAKQQAAIILENQRAAEKVRLAEEQRAKDEEAKQIAQSQEEDRQKAEEEKRAKDELAKRMAQAQESMKASFDRRLVDPGSLQLRNLKVFLAIPTYKLRTYGSNATTADVVCGEFNSKNRMGGYVGFKYFYWDSDKNDVVVADDRDSSQMLEEMARRTCSTL